MPKQGLQCGAHQPFCPVSMDRVSQGTSSGDAKTGELLLIGQSQQHDKRVGKRTSVPPHPLELG